MAEKSGRRAAIEAIEQQRLDPADLMFRRAEQLALIPTPGQRGELADEAQTERSGPGRPMGSRNRRTEEMVEFILKRYRHPALFLADTYSRPVEDLAAQLGCTVDKALELQRDCARDLLPYVMSKQPVAVQVSSSGVVQLVMQVDADTAAAIAGQPGDDALVIEGRVEKSEKSEG